MIGTNLPSGTEIVCIDDDFHTTQKPGVIYTNNLDGLTKGKIYTIKEYFATSSGPHKDEIFVCLNEITRPKTNAKHHYPGYSRARFRRLYLPECLTNLLNTKELKTVE